MTDLGLIPNEEKSELVPTQDFNYVGMNFRTTINVVRVPLDRIQNTLKQVFKALDMVKCQPGNTIPPGSPGLDSQPHSSGSSPLETPPNVPPISLETSLPATGAGNSP